MYQIEYNFRAVFHLKSTLYWYLSIFLDYFFSLVIPKNERHNSSYVITDQFSNQIGKHID